MSDIAPTSSDTLHAELRALIASSRQRLAGAVNAELTRLYWSVGKRLHTEVLGDGRANYGAQLLDKLGQQLTQGFGRGFESRNLRRMVKFAESFPDAAIVSTLSAKLSWSHLVAIVALKTPQAPSFMPAKPLPNSTVRRSAKLLSICVPYPARPSPCCSNPTMCRPISKLVCTSTRSTPRATVLLHDR